MKKSNIREMDLVLTRDKSLYIILKNKFYQCLGLYDYEMNCVMLINRYGSDLITTDHDYDIVGVVRGETKWYQLSRFREYENASKKGEDILRYSRDWKWIWKLGYIQVVSTKEFENMMYYSSDLSSKDAKNYIVTGKTIKALLNKFVNTNFIIYKNIEKSELEEFINHYYLSDFTLSDDKNYIIFRGRENIVCKKWEDTSC